jgi:hypothetical protein
MMEGMSAANAADDNRDAAPAATRHLTLRIGFVLLSGEADNGGLTSKLTLGRCHQILKRRLTLIFKVDNLLPTTARLGLDRSVYERFVDKSVRCFGISSATG